jgi:hypothetical protein
VNDEAPRRGRSADDYTPRTVALALDDGGVEALARRVVELLDERRGRRQRDFGPLVTEVGGYLLAYPAASANEVAREVRGERKEVLRVVRELRAAATRFGSRANHLPAAGAGP